MEIQNEALLMDTSIDMCISLNTIAIMTTKKGFIYIKKALCGQTL